VKRGLRTVLDKKGGDFMSDAIINLARKCEIPINKLYSTNFGNDAHIYYLRIDKE